MNKRSVHILLWTIATVCCLLLYLFCSRTIIQSVQQLEFLYDTVSLRYSQPLSASQISTALQYATSSNNEQGAFPTFWGEENTTLSASSAKTKLEHTPTIAFYGNAQTCYGGLYLAGTSPGSGSTSDCAVSDLVAWELWGSLDVVGQSIDIQHDDGSEVIHCKISGVFKADYALALYGTNLRFGFSNMELDNLSWDNPANDVQTFTRKSGLGIPSQIIYAPQIVWLVRLLSYMPLVLSLFLLVFVLLRMTLSLPRTIRLIFWFILACAVAGLTPILLDALPAWMIPIRLGDPAAWNVLWSGAKSQMREWFSIQPTTKDVICKFQLAIIVFNALLASLWTGCIYYNMKHRV